MLPTIQAHRNPLFLCFKALVSFLLLLLPLSAVSQETHVLGYCTDDIEGADMIGVDSDVRISGAIRLPKAVMQRYKDGKVLRLRVGLREGITKASVWIRKSLNESSIVVQSLGTVSYGWNEVTLNDPYIVDGDELFIGYTFTQPAGVRGMLAKGVGNENTSFVAIDNEWEDYHNHGIGILFIQAIVEADLPAHDIGVIDGMADSLYYYSGGTVTATATIENLGTLPDDGYTVSWSLDDGDPQTDSTLFPSLASGETGTVTHQFSTAELSEGSHYATVTVTPLSSDDYRSANDTLRIPFFVYTTSYPRHLLLEHFTSLPCVNCPPVDRLLANVVESRDDVVWVAHHVGYKNDEFTLDASEAYVDFGVWGNPFIMIDRYDLLGGSPAFVISNFTADDLQTVFNMAASRQSFVELTASLSGEGSHLDVTVSGESKAFFQLLYPRATINVFLVEDSVLATGSQAGDSNKRYHDNVVRSILTRKAGDLLKWTDDTHFTHTLSTEAESGWRIEKLRAVVFITAAPDRSTNYPTGEVLNATQAFISDTEGLRAISEERSSQLRYYTLDGIQVNPHHLRPGLYIIDDGHRVRKTIIR